MAMPDQDLPGGGYMVCAKVTLLVDKVWALGTKWARNEGALTPGNTEGVRCAFLRPLNRKPTSR